MGGGSWVQKIGFSLSQKRWCFLLLHQERLFHQTDMQELAGVWADRQLSESTRTAMLVLQMLCMANAVCY